jgi:glucose-6-phosphate 1-dehydrogenase
MSSILSATRPSETPVSLIVIGASGDLARKKIIPALFALYCQKLLPERFQVVGFARSSLSHEKFRETITQNLTCRYAPGESCGEKMEAFLSRCFYTSGNYDSAESFAHLCNEVKKIEGPDGANRVFYMAIPPFLFLDVARSLKNAGLVSQPGEPRWSRAVIEKPFGSDRESSDTLVRSLAEVFTEQQTYRIDHYLGKEVIQNLLVLRFANLIFDPIWNRTCIDNIEVSWKEDIGVEGRGGYFDEYGIIRDVMQNHLLQILALIAMEQPVTLQAQDIRNEKVKLLRSIPPLSIDDIALGQYSEGAWKGGKHPAYASEESVPPQSRTSTYAAAVLNVRNRRWDGVPFLLRAGKGLNARMTEIRIRFHETPGGLYRCATQALSRNILVIRVQPDEAITFQIMNKVPGLKMNLGLSDLNLRYGSAFNVEIPDAYECLILDVIEGVESLFIRSDELAAAWDIFTPVLHEIDRRGIRPQPYPFGSSGPVGADALAARYGAAWHSG